MNTTTAEKQLRAFHAKRLRGAALNAAVAKDLRLYSVNRKAYFEDRSLDDEDMSIVEAFIWTGTPEGSQYWADRRGLL